MQLWRDYGGAVLQSVLWWDHVLLCGRPHIIRWLLHIPLNSFKRFVDGENLHVLGWFLHCEQLWLHLEVQAVMVLGVLRREKLVFKSRFFAERWPVDLGLDLFNGLTDCVQSIGFNIICHFIRLALRFALPGLNLLQHCSHSDWALCRVWKPTEASVHSLVARGLDQAWLDRWLVGRRRV